MNTEKLNIKKGIERLARIYNWPNDSTITDMDKYEFRALCEFIIFKEFVFTPFFKSLLSYLFKHIGKLYQHLSTLPMDKARMLTYKEAYLFFRDLGTDKVKQILEQTSYPYNVYNRIIRSLEDEDYNLFFSALDTDYTKMMQVLWVMRYVLYGEKRDWDAFNPSTPHLEILPFFPRWIKDRDYYRQYFEIFEGDEEDAFLDNRVVEIVHGSLKRKRRRNRYSSPTNNPDEIFEEDDKIDMEKLFEKSLFKSKWKDILTDYTNNSDSPTKNNWMNTTYIEDLARLILTHNVILHKDYIKERYGIDSSEVYNQFKNTEVYIYENIDSRDFGRYILYCTDEMQNVYNLVKDIIPDQNRYSIKQLLDRCPKRHDEPDVIDDITTIDYKDKQYVKVRESKIKGSTSKEKEDNLKRNLEKLYEELINEDNPYIRSDTEKNLLIYRFSGYGNPKRPLKAIEWLKSNVLLGHIVRCLISDKSNPPENMGIVATFFNSSSGNSINLGTAKNITVTNFELEKNRIDQNFVEAVEILRRCGFINAEYTSKRR